MTMREARKVYFDANGFGETGGYDDAWVDFKLGPIPMPFPNTKARVEAVRYHDLHHLLTGYDTDIVGEFEIAAWEIAAGCKGYGAAWALNLGGMAGGLVRAPRRVFAAFVRGRGQRTTYGEELDVVLALTVGAARERFMRAAGATRRATLADVVLFLLALLVGFVVALVLFALIVPLVPVGLITHALRRRRSAARMTT
ncbi:MAG: hypothetical protein BGO98_45095 [Myxococcales bacterium 68-20]|nr:MAG: hypothetical protein BGO98_45095 [Myxococcales bacterium 68-20]